MVLHIEAEDFVMTIAVDLRNFVQPDRVHRDLYEDPQIFEMEMERLFRRAWTYAGHVS